MWPYGGESWRWRRLLVGDATGQVPRRKKDDGSARHLDRADFSLDGRSQSEREMESLNLVFVCINEKWHMINRCLKLGLKGSLAARHLPN